MNMARSRLIVLFNFCMIAVLLAACVSAAPAGSPSPAPEERVVIRLLVDMRAEPALRAGVEAFNASQDDIQLELMIEQVEYDWLVTQLQQRAENGGGDLPDLIGPWSMDHLHQYPDPWLDLSPYLDGDDLAAFDPNALRGWQNADGQLLGLPLTLHPWVIFYNRDLFDAAGLPYPPDRPGEPYADGEAWTIEKMESIAIQLTLDGYGRTPASPDFDPADVKQYGLTHVPYCAAEITALFGNPQPSIAADGKIILPEPWKEAIRWYYSAMWEKHFIPTAGAVDGPRFRAGGHGIWGDLGSGPCARAQWSDLFVHRHVGAGRHQHDAASAGSSTGVALPRLYAGSVPPREFRPTDRPASAPGPSAGLPGQAGRAISAGRELAGDCRQPALLSIRRL